VKLALNLASGYVDALETLIAAYGRIADLLPRFDRPSAGFTENHDVQQVLAIVYADILAFHEGAYKSTQGPG